MTTEVFDKLNALVLFLLPEFQMTINTGGYDEVCPKKWKEEILPVSRSLDGDDDDEKY